MASSWRGPMLAAAAAATLLLGIAGCGSVPAPGQEASSGPAASTRARSGSSHSGNGGVAWRIVNEQYDGGVGWADLGFTTATDGVVVHGPANGDGNSTGRPGQLFLTSDGGTTWQQVSF